LIVQKAIEDLSENDSEKSNSDDTDSNDTTLNWEASTASEIFSFFNGAVADAAAAEATLFLFAELVKGKLFGRFWLLFHEGHAFFIHHLFL